MTDDKSRKRQRMSQREFDIMNRMSTRAPGLKPKYSLKNNFTPLELETFNKWRRIMRDTCENVDESDTCAICGQPWPDWFFVSRDEWTHFVPHHMRKSTLCRRCYDDIRAAADNEEC